MTRLVEYADRDAQARGLAKVVAQGLFRVLSERGRASLCVPGGTTPVPFLTALSDAELDWAAIAVLPGDERWVPPDHPRSNGRLLAETLVQGRAARAQLVSLWRDAHAPEDVLTEITQAVDVILPLDVLVLGMGEDMHTASLFPGADRLAEALDMNCASSVLPMRAAAADEPRVSLTLPALLSASDIHLLIAGAAKRAAFEAAQAATSNLKAPVRAILTAADPTIHYAP